MTVYSGSKEERTHLTVSLGFLHFLSFHSEHRSKRLTNITGATAVTQVLLTKYIHCHLKVAKTATFLKKSQSQLACQQQAIPYRRLLAHNHFHSYVPQLILPLEVSL